jgi:hypothetical protein
VKQLIINITTILSEDLKRFLFKLFVSSFDYWSRKELRFINDFYDYLSAHPESDSFLKSRTVGYCLPSKDDESFWNKDMFMGILPNSQFGDIAVVDVAGNTAAEPLDNEQSVRP